MSEPPDFRLEQSELRGEDEYTRVRARGPRVLRRRPGDVRQAAAVSRRREPRRERRRRGDRRGADGRRDLGPAGRPVRPARDPVRADHVGPGRVVDPARGRALRAAHRRRRRRRAGRALAPRAGPPRDPREGVPRRRFGRDPGGAGRRPLDHVPVGGCGRAPRVASQARGRPLRRARRRGELDLRIADLARHADAPADRRGVGAGLELRPGRAARVLAREGDVRLDARAGVPLAHDRRDRGARGGRGDRRRDRGGARRPRGRLPLGRHRRGRPGDGAGDRDAGARRDDRPRAAACGPPGRRRGGAGRHGRGRGLAAVRPERGHGHARLSCGHGGAVVAGRSARVEAWSNATGSRSSSCRRSTRCRPGCTSASRTSR